MIVYMSVAYTGIWKGGGTRGGLGACPQGVKGQRPSGGSRAKPPEAERFPLKSLVKLCNIL